MGKAKAGLPVGIPVGVNAARQGTVLQDDTEIIAENNPQSGFSDAVNKPEPLPYTIETIAIEVPVVRGIRGYASNRVDARLTERQAIELRAITAGLRHRGATLLDGRPVDRPSHTIEWLLEQHIRDTDDIRRGDGRSS